MAIKSLPRRRFLTTGATLTGALALGFFDMPAGRARALAQTPPQPNRPPVDPERFSWIAIGRDGAISLLTPKSEMGQGVYTAWTMMVAEELNVEMSRVRIVTAHADPKRFRDPFLRKQATFGSTGVAAYFYSVSAAAAALRMMLIEAAATAWQVDVATCSTAEGYVKHDASGRRAGYGELVDAARKLPIPMAAPKRAEDTRLIGKPVKRVDTPSKVTGEARYGIDMALPGLKTALLLVPPHVGGRLESFDSRTAVDVHASIQVVEVAAGLVVAADSFWHAQRAKQRLKVVWAKAAVPHPDNVTLEARLRDALDKGVLVNRFGAPEAKLTDAALIRAEYQAPFLAHVPMEPLNCTARFADDKLDIWTGTQDQEETLKAAMEVTGLTADRINIHTQLLGGGFGRRAATDFVKPAIEAARKTGHPIKLIVERAEELRMGYFRPAACARLEAALTPDGRIAALRTHVAAPSVDVPFFGRLLIDGQADWFATQGLSTPHYVAEDRVTYYARVETGLPVWVWRGVGFTQNCFFLESFIDELAAAAKLDPLEFRLKNLQEPRARKVLETAAERAGWGRGVAPGRAQGMALFFHAQLVTALVVEVSMEEGKRPKVHRATCVLDAGRVINPDIVKAQAEGGLMMGLAPVLHGGVEVRDGAVAQSNFHDYRVAKMADAPVIDVHLIEGTRAVAMLGEFTTVLVAPAVANAVFRLTGTRRRSFPI